jgi:hypothetical protein
LDGPRRSKNAKTYLGGNLTAHIDPSGRLVNDQESSFALTCPHCQVLAHLTPIAVPSFNDLQLHRPRHAGVVFRCDACNEPIFLRFPVRLYGSQRIELSPQFSELERAPETFTFNHLPEEVELLFREALTCFTAGTFNAFAGMCRRAAHATFADLGEAGKLRLFDELNAMRDMAQLELETFTKVKNVIFGGAIESRPGPPLIDSYEAGILLEAMKDLLYEGYVRKGKLQEAMSVRRSSGEETLRKVTSITQAK